MNATTLTPVAIIETFLLEYWSTLLESYTFFLLFISSKNQLRHIKYIQVKYNRPNHALYYISHQ